jgi:hypothetical protein
MPIELLDSNGYQKRTKKCCDSLSKRRLAIATLAADGMSAFSAIVCSSEFARFQLKRHASAKVYRMWCMKKAPLQEVLAQERLETGLPKLPGSNFLRYASKESMTNCRGSSFQWHKPRSIRTLRAS